MGRTVGRNGFFLKIDNVAEKVRLKLLERDAATEKLYFLGHLSFLFSSLEKLF